MLLFTVLSYFVKGLGKNMTSQEAFQADEPVYITLEYIYLTSITF